LTLLRNIQERETQEVDEKEVSISEKQKSDKDLTLIRKWVEKGEKTRFSVFPIWKIVYMGCD
jgi:hypothetical protein